LAALAASPAVVALIICVEGAADVAGLRFAAEAGGAVSLLALGAVAADVRIGLGMARRGKQGDAHRGCGQGCDRRTKVHSRTPDLWVGSVIGPGAGRYSIARRFRRPQCSTEAALSARSAFYTNILLS
jgi:hypothetical protein